MQWDNANALWAICARPRLPPITVGSQALQSTLSNFWESCDVLLQNRALQNRATQNRAPTLEYAEVFVKRRAVDKDYNCGRDGVRL